ncbi:MAG TPA: VIT domain-containing protein [Myxococcota bacterium]|jgi:Ca-activated chloride channel family protein|nr:VIT domain-containing protein [Myxococcota bacterium]
MKARVSYLPVVLGPIVVGTLVVAGFSLAAKIADRAVPGGGGGAGAPARTAPGRVMPSRTDVPAEIPLDGSSVAKLVGVSDTGEKVLEFPLEHTTVTADVTGNVARVELQQVFKNPLTARLEAIYQFPLPENAAVTDMFFRIGRRIVYSEVRERAEARAVYEEAKAAGKAAALTEEERPNLFTQSVANIPPGETIVVTLRYVHEVPFSDGHYHYVFPMTIGPRYVPGGGAPLADGADVPTLASTTPAALPGTSPVPTPAGATARVPDAARITPPVMAPGWRSAHEVDVTVRLHPGAAFTELASINHAVDTSADKGATLVTLADTPEDRLPNRDLVLEYRPTGGVPEPFLLSEVEKGDRYVMLFLQPPTDVTAEMVRAKEMVFLIDVSGSMSGEPVETAKELVRRSLTALGPDDTFQIVAFAGEALPLEPAPLPNTPANVKRGLDDLGKLFGGGGTEMLAGIRAALDPPADPSRLRMVVLFTDGWIGDEREIIDAVEARRGETRVFGFGIGDAPNRYLLEGVAAAGRGVADYVALGEDADTAVARLYSRLDRPLLTDIDLAWEGKAPAEAYPARTPDLFAGQPLVIAAKLAPGADAPTAVTVKGKLGRKPYARRVAVDLAGAAGTPVLGTLWARRKITDLVAADTYEGEGKHKVEIVALGIKFKMVTRFTSLVAVERMLRADVDLPLTTVLIPGELPEGTSYEGIFGADGDGKGAGDGADVTPMRVKPGDPEIRIDGPRDARVTVSLPWAAGPLTAVWDDGRGQWVARFLVPAAWPDGAYGLAVRVELKDGRVEERTATVKVDTSAAAVAVVSSPDALHAGETVTLGFKPAVGLGRMASAMAAAGGARAALEALKSLSEVKEMLVAAPWGEVALAAMDPATGVYHAALHVPAGTPAGAVLLEVVASDAAGNVSRRTLTLDVVEEGSHAATLSAVVGSGAPRGLFSTLLVGLALVGVVAVRSRARARTGAD